MIPPKEDRKYFSDLALRTLKELETDQGILASSREEQYGCVFGRDTLITCLKLLRVYRKGKGIELLAIVRKALFNLALLQGTTTNIESGEQPGKCIHEYRPTGHERLTIEANPPWFVYEDTQMRNYDSVDATPLMLIAFYRYWQTSEDQEFLNQTMPHIEAALDWCINFGDSNRDGFVDYQLTPERKSGGLVTQNWMDSAESVFHEETGEIDNRLVYPMAPVEVQAYVWLSYKLWEKFFSIRHPAKSEELSNRAAELKTRFNQVFVTRDPDNYIYLAPKLDGEGRLLRSVRSNMGHVLWASLNAQDDGAVDSILDLAHVPDVVRRLMMPDMFEPKAGIRTLSTFSREFKPNSYHNGSIWPHDNMMIAEGFEIHGFRQEAAMVADAILSAIGEFGTAIELYVYQNNKYFDYCSVGGQVSCKKQAWSAAAILDAVSGYGHRDTALFDK